MSTQYNPFSGMMNTTTGQNALQNKNPFASGTTTPGDAFNTGLNTSLNMANPSTTTDVNTNLDNPLAEFDSANFDVNDPEQVKSLQQQMGIKDDGMFGPQTEKAYRGYINQARVGKGQEAYSYGDQSNNTRDGFGFGQFKPFQNLKEGRGLFGKEDGFLSGEGRMSEDRQWTPFQNMKERREDRRYGSGESVVPQSTLDALDDAEFGVSDAFPSTDYGSGESVPKQQWTPFQNMKQGIEDRERSQLDMMPNFNNRNQVTEDLNNEVNNVINGVSTNNVSPSLNLENIGSNLEKTHFDPNTLSDMIDNGSSEADGLLTDEYMSNIYNDDTIDKATKDKLHHRYLQNQLNFKPTKSNIVNSGSEGTSTFLENQQNAGANTLFGMNNGGY